MRNKKSKHHKRNRSSSSASSSSSSCSRKRARNISVQDTLRASEFVVYSADLLPSDSIVQNIGKRNRRLATKGVQDACRRSLEEFVPSYLGRDLAADERKKVVLARKSLTYLEAPQFMEHWMSYWISHGIHGLITNKAFCTAFAVMTKFVSQRGPGVAAKYFRALIPHINAKIATLGQGEYFENLDTFITTLNNELLQDLKAFSGGAERWPRPPKPTRPPTAPPPAPSKSTRPAVGVVKSERVCLSHNIKQGLTCANGKSCKYLHLDTNNPANLKRWNQTKADVDKHRASKGKGKRAKSAVK